MTDEPKTQHRVLVWATTYPTLALIAVLFLLVVGIEILFPPSVVSTPGYVFVLFALGAYTIVSVVRGFLSVFGPAFTGSPPAAKRRTLLLCLALLLPCFGIAAFIAIAIGEFIGQMQCRGAGCAQGGIATTLFLVVAWMSYFVTKGLSSLMLKLGWWPDGITPKF
ncbi:MAG: hypothetical protein WAV95_19590 [Azonexus sp.]